LFRQSNHLSIYTCKLYIYTLVIISQPVKERSSSLLGNIQSLKLTSKPLQHMVETYRELIICTVNPSEVLIHMKDVLG